MESRTKVKRTSGSRTRRKAEASAEKQLEDAQARLDSASRSCAAGADLDQQTKRIMIVNQQKG